MAKLNCLVKFFIERSLQGESFFDELPIGSLQNQSQGIFIGNGDQDNYITYGTENWSADDFFTGGSVYFTNVNIVNSDNDALYSSERYGNMSYAIPVPTAGNYYLIIHAKDTGSKAVQFIYSK